MRDEGVAQESDSENKQWRGDVPGDCSLYAEEVCKGNDEDDATKGAHGLEEGLKAKEMKAGVVVEVKRCNGEGRDDEA